MRSSSMRASVTNLPSAVVSKLIGGVGKAPIQLSSMAAPIEAEPEAEQWLEGVQVRNRYEHFVQFQCNFHWSANGRAADCRTHCFGFDLCNSVLLSSLQHMRSGRRWTRAL